MRSEVFNDKGRFTWPLFTTVGEVRAKFPANTIVQVAIGGWGNSEGFEIAAKTEESRKLFAENVRAMIEATGADGVDIDWEYPGSVLPCEYASNINDYTVGTAKTTRPTQMTKKHGKLLHTLYCSEPLEMQLVIRKSSLLPFLGCHGI